MNIREIEALTVNNVEELRKEGKAELIKIKEHSCYLIDLGEYFGYSVLVFKNNKHIHYANDYQLHHSKENTIEELKQWYIKTLNNKLFTESELMKNVKDYDDYKRKDHYIRNYWIMQFDYVSIFYIGKPDEKQEKAEKEMLYCSVCFCYVNDKIIIENANKFINNIKESFTILKENTEVFRKMIAYELANHEAGYICDYENTLDSLGLNFEELTTEQQKIVNEELRKQIANCY